jgi:hypothetical protein
MNQTTFSEIVREYLIKNYPGFVQTISYETDGSFVCSLKNPKGIFSVWIATYDIEITVGLEDCETGNSDCHTHMSFYGDEPNEQTEAMSKCLEDIFSDRLIFYQSSLSGFSWTDDIQETQSKKRKNELLEFYKWNDR